MENLSLFLKQNKKQTEIVKFAATDSILDETGKPVEWQIRPLKSEEVDNIRDECMKITKNGKEIKVDNAKFNRKIAVACTVYPDLNSKELQDSYGVMGAEQLIQVMLDKAGEFQEYVNKIMDISGYNKHPQETINEIKN